MTNKSLSNQSSVLGQRALKCYKMYKDGVPWEQVVASDSLMIYSKDFRKFVAEKCGVDPDSGCPLKQPTFTEEELAELRKADAAIDAEEETEAGPVEDEEKAAEEADKVDDEEEEVEEKEVEEEEETEEEEEETEEEEMAYDLCHWCNAAPATVVLTLQVSDGDEPRVLRLDHLCPDCAAEYWNAVRATHKERMG